MDLYENVRAYYYINIFKTMKLNQSQIDHYRQFGYRFAIAAIYSLLSFVVGLCGVVVSPVTMSVVQAY